MKQVFIKNGNAVVEQVPAPRALAGEILIRVRASCISVGTEMSGVHASDAPLWKRALRQPDKVFKALQMMRERGVATTLNVVQGQVNAALVVGYSAAGEVIACGAGVDGYAVGQAVACAGAQAAHHAEIVRVPRNLVVPMPAAVAWADAATVTLGAIALQGVRRTEPTLGETVVVVGLGLLGQITAQLLRANGCRVIGVDLDAARIERALELGMEIGLAADTAGLDAEVARLTDGYGADAVIVTAASSNAGLLNAAFALCRRKARMVLVGDVPINIDRAAIYRNEIDFRISTSYGPGRYDRSYEEDGLDYPLAYVRWTENRNMQAYLGMIASGAVSPASLIDSSYTVDEAPQAYALLKSAEAGAPRPLGVILTYPEAADEAALRATTQRRDEVTPRPGTIGVGIAGAGAFVRSVHLPNLAQMADRFQVRAVMTQTAHAAHSIATSTGAALATTDFEALLGDAAVDLVMIGTRHDSHGRYVLAALAAGKHVFVEKPLTLDAAELAQIEAFYADAAQAGPLLMTGFNRRFAPAVRALSAALGERRGPLMVSYRMNAGAIPLDHWVHGAAGGGRNLGEACHIYDLFTALTNARLIEVTASAVPPQAGIHTANENFSAVLRFDDGSVCQLLYTAMGHGEWPKEQMEVFCDGAVYHLDDYTRLSVAGGRGRPWSGAQDKGHRAELAALADAIAASAVWPIPLWQQLQATRAAFAVEAAIAPSASA